MQFPTARGSEVGLLGQSLGMHLIHAFIHSFSHQLFIEPPLGAKRCSKKAAQIRAPAPEELTSQKSSAGFTTLETED